VAADTAQVTLTTKQLDLLLQLLRDAPVHPLRVATRTKLRSYPPASRLTVTLNEPALAYLVELADANHVPTGLHDKLYRAVLRAEHNRRSRGIKRSKSADPAGRPRRARHQTGGPP
jgi:hypothetical protein